MVMQIRVCSKRIFANSLSK